MPPQADSDFGYLEIDTTFNEEPVTTCASKLHVCALKFRDVFWVERYKTVAVVKARANEYTDCHFGHVFRYEGMDMS